MAEAFAALGIAANIFQFLDLGFKATQTIITTYRNLDIDGLAQHNAEIASTCYDFEKHCTRLKSAKAVVKDDDLTPLLTRCIDAATKLGAEIGRLRVPDSKRHRRRTKVKISIMSYWKSNTIEGLKADLGDIREQLCFRLQELIYKHHRSLVKSVDAWGKASKKWNRAEKKLDAMAEQVENLLKAESKADPGSLNELAQILTTFAEEATSHSITRAILESLHFTQIKERQNEIPKAHKDTFKWIFSENAPGNFSNWLQKSTGIFWITGKPGSGKSTLMKFILAHETTKDLATVWAGSKPLLLASHFFWFGGTKLQKSQEGLLRTLLFQVLSNAPELISKVLPERIFGFQYLESWTLEELSDAFGRLQALPSLPCRILILVDGLDEYSGQGTDLAEFLFAATRSPDIKACCASRPWLEFRKAFLSAFGRIRMHDLTTEDMRLYVRSTLSQNEHFKNLQSSNKPQAQLLVDSISTKAEGVFFWVSLVVKSLVRGLNNKDGLETLQRRVSEFPPDLEGFFKRITDSIEDVYKHEVATVFSTLLMAKTSMPLLLFMARDSAILSGMVTNSMNACSKSGGTSSSLSWHEEMHQTAKSVHNQQLPRYGELKPDDPGITKHIDAPNNWRLKEAHEFKHRLLGRCRDLIQAWQVPNSHAFDIRLGFLHRTVIEFLQNKEYRSVVHKNPILNHRYFVARSCLRVLSFDTSEKDINMEFILWFLYILQKTQVLTEDQVYDDKFTLIARCNELKEVLLNNTRSLLGWGESKAEALRLVSLSQARLLVQIHASDSMNTDVNFMEYIQDLGSDTILLDVLLGSADIEVGDRPIAIWSESIDLELLNNLLQIQGFRKHIVQPEATTTSYTGSDSVWEHVIQTIAKDQKSRPRNLHEACEVMIRNGAARSFARVDVDVIQYLRENNIFTEDEVGTLEKLFPPEMPAGRRGSKKTRRRRGYRKGKKKR